MLIISCKQIFAHFIFVGQVTHKNLSPTKISSSTVSSHSVWLHWMCTHTHTHTHTYHEHKEVPVQRQAVPNHRTHREAPIGRQTEREGCWVRWVMTTTVIQGDIEQ